MAKEPDGRHRSGLELAEELRAAGAFEPAPVGAFGFERTIRADRTPSDPREPRPADADFERRAAAVGSAAAVLLTRATVAAKRALAQKLIRVAAATWPVVRRATGSGVCSFNRSLRRAADLWISGWRSGPPARVAMTLVPAILIGAIALGGYEVGGYRIATRASEQDQSTERFPSSSTAGVKPHGGALIPPGSEPPFSGLLSRLTGTGPTKASVVRVRVTHGLSDGELTVWSDERKVLSEDLEAPEKALNLFGRKLFSYRRANAEWFVRLPEGKHTLRVRVRSRERGLELTRELSNRLETDGHYKLDVSVKSWPSPKLDLDWTSDSTNNTEGS